MRLIDADELMEKVYSIKYLRKLKAKELCDECKTIEAVPNAWLENWLLIHHGMLPIYEDLMRDWKKENG